MAASRALRQGRLTHAALFAPVLRLLAQRTLAQRLLALPLPLLLLARQLALLAPGFAALPLLLTPGLLALPLLGQCW